MSVDPAPLVRRALASAWLRAGALAFLLWGVYCLAFGIPTVDPWIPYRIDLDVYRLGAQVFLDGGDLYAPLPDTEIGANLPFTYPPLAAILFVPLTWVPLQVANLLFSLGTLAALWLVVWLVTREAFGLGSGEAAWAAVAMTSLLLWLIPIRETIEFGQVNVYLMALVVVDVVVGRGRWWQGALVGLALAIKLTPAVFLAYFLIRTDWRALLTGVVSALVYTGIGFLVLPAASAEYWSETLRDPTRIGELAYVSNQSLNGLLHRFFWPEGVTTVVWFVLCAVIGLLLLWLMWRLFGAGHDVVAMVGLGVYALLASPVSWAHHWVWVAPAMVALLAWGWRAGGARGSWLLLVVALAVVVFYGRGIWQVAPEPTASQRWAWWEYVVGNSYVWWGLLFMVVVWAVTPLRRQPQRAVSV